LVGRRLAGRSASTVLLTVFAFEDAVSGPPQVFNPCFSMSEISCNELRVGF
jgi:hypothetical protein